jgi:hypothetical protein
MEWTPYRFDDFGLSCDLFRGAPVAVELDARAAERGYLAQGEGALSLFVSYGPEATLDVWLERALAGGPDAAHVAEARTPARLCGGPAERVVVEVAPTPPAWGHWPDGTTAPPVEPGAVRLALVSGRHRGTPLVAAFRRPAADAAAAEAEAHFFDSFRCDA